MCFMEEKTTPFWGIQNEMNKEPLTPNADGKIHAKWYENGNVAPKTISF